MDEQREGSPTEFDIHTTRAAMLSSLNHRKQLASLLAGGFAGTFASTITCPLEVIKTKLQSISSVQSGGKHASFLSVTKNIARQEGFRGFFRGLLPTWIGILPARATYFWAYSTTKSVLSHVFGESDARTHVTSAAMAGIVSNALTNPIWMVKTRMQLDVGGSNAFHYRGYGDACRRIMAEEGVAGFYKGLTASFWGVSEGAIHFLFYERLKAFLQRQRQAKLGAESAGSDADKLPAVQYLLAAGFSKLIASTLTYPHEVVRTRLREQRPLFPGGPLKYRSVPHALWVIGREEGRRGLYSGMGTHLLRVVPNTALMFLTYELVSRWIEKYYAQRDEGHSTKTAQMPSSQFRQGSLR
jgi:solute carrier family 25 protein 33/36